jgi:hypothetical protein
MHTTAGNRTFSLKTLVLGLLTALLLAAAINTPPALADAPGETWTARASANDYSWRSVAYGNGRFVAVSTTGASNRVMTSVDGINWTPRASAAENSWWSVTFGDGKFVAVSGTGDNNRVMTSTDGESWFTQATPESADGIGWRSITYGNGRFVAVASSGTGKRVMTSPDGTVWTSQDAAAVNSWYSVAYGNGLFVAVSGGTGSGNRVMTSTDGENWTASVSAPDNTWRSVVYGAGRFVAVASGSGDKVMTSPNGLTWTSQSSAADNEWYGVTYGAGLFAAVAQTGSSNRIMVSPDGVSWTSRLSPADSAWENVVYHDGIFVAVASSGTGNRVMTSGDLGQPVNAAVPVISGTRAVGKTLTATPGTWTGTPTPTYSYQWKSCDSAVGGTCVDVGTNSPSYALQAGDYLRYIEVEVTATNSVRPETAGSARTGAIAGSTPVNTALPAVSGTAYPGNALTVSDGTWTGVPTPVLTYQWQESDGIGGPWTDITGATTNSYTVLPADLGIYLRAQVTGSNTAGASTADAAGVYVALVPPSVVTAASISGPAHPGQALTGDRGVWAGDNPTFSYQWQASDFGTGPWTDISGATQVDYTVRSADAERYLRLIATASNQDGSASSESNVLKATVVAPGQGIVLNKVGKGPRKIDQRGQVYLAKAVCRSTSCTIKGTRATIRLRGGKRFSGRVILSDDGLASGESAGIKVVFSGKVHKMLPRGRKTALVAVFVNAVSNNGSRVQRSLRTALIRR